jgi:pyruvate dehydrogenase E2 component (dihydrolipoamide acetyltransferase)
MALEQSIKVPDIGGATGVDVIEILVKVGDVIEENSSLVTLESDKASMEIPSPMAGTVRSIKMKLGDKVSEGDVILSIETQGTATAVKEERKPEPQAVTEAPKPAPERASPQTTVAEKPGLVLASPAVRRMLREQGLSLQTMQGTGRKGRISKEDVEDYLQHRSRPSLLPMPGMAPAAVIDFSQFGVTETKALNKIKRLTALNVHRSWLSIPHVTQFDEADITELEAFRKAETPAAQAAGYKLTLLAFVCKVVCKALMVYPQFNASLDASGENLIYKKYYNIGIAVETPNGLVVPVLKGVEALSVSDIAKEMARLSTKARDKGLMPADMSGGCFTISSLGGIGGTAFTPIVNSPEVAILGLSRSSIQACYRDGSFVPRLMLPLSLSYDHRVIDGAEAARFARYVSEGLSDLRRILV